MTITPRTDHLIDLALDEDAGLGDVTSRAIFPAQHTSRAIIEAKQDLVVCGLDVAARVFARVDPALKVTLTAHDGERVKTGGVVLRVTGPTAALLTAERTALNFIQRLSGVATLSRKFAAAVDGTGTRIVDTRKTTPGWRALEKYAVRCGGCVNHRSSLGEHVLIKDNHIAAAGSLTTNGPITTGAYRPSNFGTGDFFPAPAPASGYGTALADFIGTNPNGDWKLFIVDDQGSDVGLLASGWRLSILTTQAPVVAPTVQAVFTGGVFTLTWPLTPSGFGLESSPLVGAPPVWTSVLPLPLTVGTNKSISITNPTGRLFYRLLRP